MSTPVPPSTYVGLTSGEILGEKYRIDGFLGEGGMGVVLSATHLELGSAVAIKVVRDDLVANEAVVSRLIFEARAMARMRSAHVVRVLDVARMPTGAPYIVMERLQGWDLATALAKHTVFSLGEAIGCLLQACDGLAEAHQLGIIHRDLKPENLFLATTPEGVVLKILDFGISKDISAKSGARQTLTKRGSAVGSPLYMSPEQMRASPDLDARADIWSLGCILFELLTGRCPFEADSPEALCAQVMVGEAPSLLELCETVPQELDDIVRRCLQKDPEQRFHSVTELAQALRAFVAEQQRAYEERVRAKALREEQAYLDQVRVRPGLNKRAALGAFAAAILAASLTATLSHESSRSALLGWLAPRHAAAAELERGTAPSVLRASRVPSALTQPSPPQPASETQPASDTASPLAAVGGAAPEPAKQVEAKPRRVLAGPLYYIPNKAQPSAPRSSEQPASENVAARYGL